VFGRHKDLEEKLRASGRTALARIDAAEQTPWAVGLGPDSVAANTEIVWKLKLHVTPEGEEPFDAETSQSWPQLEIPRVGQAPVLYDPEDHARVVLDHSVGSQEAAGVAMVESRLTPEATAAIERFGGGSVHDLLSTAMSDPQGFAAQMRERAAEAQRDAMAQAEAFQAQAQAAQAQAAQAQAAQAGASSAPTGGTGDDPVAQLERLAALRAQGLLTDQEFEALKKRIIQG
jgi:hypothetical protein